MRECDECDNQASHVHKRCLQHRLFTQDDLARARQAGYDEARDQAAEVAEMWSDNPKSVSAKIRAMRPRADKSLPGDRDLGGGTLTFPGEPRCPKHNSPCGYDCMDRTPTCVWCSDKHDGSGPHDGGV